MRQSLFPSIGYVFYLTVCLLWVGSKASAAPVVQRRIQAQKAAQQQYQQQVIAQQQAQQIAAYKQAVAQKQAAVQQQAAYQKAAAEYSAYKAAMQQAVAQRKAELEAAAKVKAVIEQKQAAAVAAAARAQQAANYKRAAEMVQYKQAVQAKQLVDAQTQARLNQEIKQYADFLAKRKAALAAQGIQVQQEQTARELARYGQSRAAQDSRSSAVSAVVQTAAGAEIAKEIYDSNPDQQQSAEAIAEPETVVNIKDLWRALDSDAESWTQIIDQEIKVLTVAEYVDRFKRAGIVIKKAPGYYVNVIDTIAGQDPGYLSAPFMNVLAYAAIADYDFENGQNKDELARRILGEANFKANRARLQIP